MDPEKGSLHHLRLQFLIVFLLLAAYRLIMLFMLLQSHRYHCKLTMCQNIPCISYFLKQLDFACYQGLSGMNLNNPELLL